MYLVPPMADDPPPEFVAFVVTRVAELQAETDRLTGGDPEGDHLCLEVLADVAGHWRRLCWWSRLARRDAAGEYLRHRLRVRTKRWRDDQVYEVDVRVMPPQIYYTPVRPKSLSIALRKAGVLPGTARAGALAVADAGIAWVQASRREQWHRIGRLIALGILLIGGMIQFMNAISSTP
jgi:hypothetical protein